MAISKEKIKSDYENAKNMPSDNFGKLDDATRKFRNKKGSIISSAKENVFEFPVFMSSSVPMDYATAVNSLLEQVYASYLQMAVSINPIIKPEEAANGLQFSHLKSDTGRYIEYTDTDWQHEACHNIIDEDGCVYEFNMITVSKEDNNAIMEHVNHQPLSEFDHFFTEAKKDDKDTDTSDIDDRKNVNKAGKAMMNAVKRLNELEEKLKTANDSEKEQLKKEIELLKKEKDLTAANNKSKQLSTKAPKFISNTEIDKLNTLRPILMTVDMNIMSTDGHLSPVQYVVGAKTHCRIIDADTIPEVAEYPLKEMNKVVRKAKWRAGELKFFSDIVFRIKQKKQTAVDSRNPKRKWYRRLYELAHMKGDAPTTDIVKGNSVIASFILDKLGRPRSAHGVIPNCTLVISKTDVDICKMKTDIDLLDGKTASKLCEELFLMGIVVVDTDQESIKMLLPDISSEYDVHSLASVNRQIAQLDINGQKGKEFSKFMK